jgi:hypothetical protein
MKNVHCESYHHAPLGGPQRHRSSPGGKRGRPPGQRPPPLLFPVVTLRHKVKAEGWSTNHLHSNLVYALRLSLSYHPAYCTQSRLPFRFAPLCPKSRAFMHRRVSLLSCSIILFGVWAQGNVKRCPHYIIGVIHSVATLPHGYTLYNSPLCKAWGRANHRNYGVRVNQPSSPPYSTAKAGYCHCFSNPTAAKKSKEAAAKRAPCLRFLRYGPSLHYGSLSAALPCEPPSPLTPPLLYAHRAQTFRNTSLAPAVYCRCIANQQAAQPRPVGVKQHE